MIIVQIIAILVIPVLLIKLQEKVNWLKAIVMAYVLGVSFGNLFPKVFDIEVLHQATGISIILAIPLMLFPSKVKSWLSQPMSLLKAYGLAVLATTITVVLAYFIFQEKIEDIALVSGMVEGVYTGGTVNLNAVGLAFNAPEGLSVLLNGFDMAFSAIYLLAIFTLLPGLLSRFLPASKKMDAELDGEEGLNPLNLRHKVAHILQGLGFTLLVLGVVIGLSYALFGNENELFIVFGVSLLGLGFSTLPKVTRLKGNMILADYLMMVFAFCLGAQANVNEIFMDQSGLLFYFLFTYLMMLTLHLLLSKLFKVDVDAFLISSTAAVFGPPFIGPVAESLKNRGWIGPGIVIALIGNAIGTYLGILIVQILS